jgi:hypothetical protein
VNQTRGQTHASQRVTLAKTVECSTKVATHCQPSAIFQRSIGSICTPPTLSKEHRTVRSKGCLSNKTAPAMIFKLAEAAEKSWRSKKSVLRT